MFLPDAVHTTCHCNSMHRVLVLKSCPAGQSPCSDGTCVDQASVCRGQLLPGAALQGNSQGAGSAEATPSIESCDLQRSQYPLLRLRGPLSAQVQVKQVRVEQCACTMQLNLGPRVCARCTHWCSAIYMHCCVCPPPMATTTPVMCQTSPIPSGVLVVQL